MTATLRAHDLVFAHGAQEVLSGVSLSLFPGHRVGIVGPNGVGKSTLLRVLAGLLDPDLGSVTLTPPSATVGYLQQEPDRRAGEKVLDYLARVTGVTAATTVLQTATEALAVAATGSEDTYSTALERWLELGGADLDTRAAAVLDDLGIGADLAHRATTVLSGGEAARVSLAGILLARFDVLLLDEPTNDLDFNGLARLEAFVGRADTAIAIVSHDRAFLERTITHVVELHEHERTAATFAGGWNAYLDNAAVTRRHAEEDYATYAQKRDTLQQRAQKQRLWSNRGVANAKQDTSENDKIIRAHRIATSEKVASKARATERALERLDVVGKPWKGWSLRLEIAQAPRSGDVVARFDGAIVRRGAFELGPIDLQVNWADRLAIVGANGSGKTTFLDLLMRRTTPHEGGVWIGPGVVIGDLEQRRSRFVGEEALLDVFVSASGMLPVDARTLLAKFGLGADHVGRDATSLSPGERTRASLALFQACGVNCLVLDEPTNHLDLPAIEQLESALDNFAGTVCLVSHDRVLLERFVPTQTLHIDGGRIDERHPDR